MPASPLMMEFVTSPDLGLKFRSMSAREEISRLFEFQVVAIATSATVAPGDLLGQKAAVSLQVGGDAKRWFHGVVAAFGIDGVDGRHLAYRITLRPWFWLATRSANLRIFQNQSVPDIVKAVFSAYNGTVADDLQGSYAPRVYCVQYRETDFEFVSRLLEEEGIGYFFRHGADQHELVLVDKPSSFQPMAGYANVPYTEDEQRLAELEAISSWHMRHEIQTGKVVVRDWNFTQPATDLTASAVVSGGDHAQTAFEVYDYPGRYDAAARGGTLAQVRVDEHSSLYGRYSGGGNTPGLAAGSTFTLQDHPRADQNAKYLVRATRIEMQQAGYESGDERRTSFRCEFEAQGDAEPYRPERTTRKPTVAGPQTAIVVGDGGDGAITTDEYGRVKVQFHWDRLGHNDGDSSCWVRVASPWAGNGWGMIALPRLGQEVVVDFLEGDPDQPIITGRVYNAMQKVPYALPDNKTVSTIKSRSLQGAAAEFNELRFEDKAGSELVWLQAQKDMMEMIEADLTTQIGKDQQHTVGGDLKAKVSGAYSLGVTGAVKQKFDAALGLEVASDIAVKGGGVYSLKAEQDITAESGAAISLKSKSDLHVKIGGNIGAEAAQNVYIKGGTNIVIEGGTNISLVVGGNSVVLSPAGVSITGTIVQINSGGSPGSGSPPQPVAPSDPPPPDAPATPVDPMTHR
ncbi:MAG: type VI secretion system tip protein VgrG [Burkholderiales bacterium]|nr:type VI secretion system tip protein VgrG [Burkholderiales bacterium]